ncbi:hypothetical protein P9112_014035 [Eukaryota sp. TZLM1-RC]
MLFNPINISGVNVPNRVMKSALWEGMSDPDTLKVTPELINLYEELAKGDVGLIIISATSVSASGALGPRQISLFSDDHTEGIRQIVDVIHKYNSKCAIQLAHAGRHTYNCDPIGPSDHDFPKAPACRAATKEDMDSILDDFVSAAKRAADAGVDFIQLHFAHGYLLNQFLSPALNHRTDEFGGSLENRLRYPIKVLQAIKQAVSIPVGVKLSPVDRLEGGNTIEEGIEISKALVQNGCDFIEVSGGTGISKSTETPIRRGKFEGDSEGYHLDDALAIKNALKQANLDTIVAVVGGIRSGKGAERCLEAGVDMVSVGRALIPEPHLVKIWKEDPEQLAFCKNCSQCFKPIFQGEGVRCVQLK